MQTMRLPARLALVVGALATGACVTPQFEPVEVASVGVADNQRAQVLAACSEPQRASAAEPAFTFETLEEQGFTGAVAVLEAGEVLFCRATGLGAPGVDYSAELPADVGSISKPATALAILALFESGRLKLDDTLSTWFKEVPADKANVTIRQLLLHQSGLPEYIAETKDYSVVDQREAIRTIFSMPLKFDPGSDWGYSNAGFTLLAALVERASGRPYFEAMDDLVFTPAGVQATYDPARFEQVANVRRGQGWTDLKRTATPTAGPFWGLWGAGGLYMSAADLALFMKAFMDGRIVSTDTVARARIPAVSLDEKNAGGLAFGLVKRQDRWVYYFNGMGESGSADVWGDPHTERVVAVTANSTKPHAIAAGRRLAKVVLTPAAAAPGTASEP